MRQPLPSLQSLIKRVQFTTSKRYQHKRVLTVVFLQSVQHLQKPQGALQHPQPLQNEQFIQNGDESYHILEAGVRVEKCQLAQRGREYTVLREWL